jgi:hypothetical protein
MYNDISKQQTQDNTSFFHYIRWGEERQILDVFIGGNNLSRLLGGKSTAYTDDSLVFLRQQVR